MPLYALMFPGWLLPKLKWFRSSPPAGANPLHAQSVMPGSGLNGHPSTDDKMPVQAGAMRRDNICSWKSPW